MEAGSRVQSGPGQTLEQSGSLSGDQQLMERNVRYRLVKFDHYPGVLSLILLSAQAGSRKGHETGILHGKTKTAWRGSVISALRDVKLVRLGRKQKTRI